MRRLAAFGVVMLSVLVAGAVHAADPSPAKEPPVAQLEGTSLDAGTTVEAPAGTVKHLVLAIGGARVTLHPGASVVVSAPQWFPPEQGGKSIRGSRLFLRSGELTVQVPEDKAKPAAVSVVLGGGQQSVLLWHGVSRVIARDGDMSVAVDEGAAYVGSQDQWIRLGTGAAALLAKNAPPRLYKQRLAAPVTTSCEGSYASPRQEGSSGLGLVLGEEKAAVHLCWNAVAGASGYRVELASDEAMAQLVDTIELPSTALTADTRLPAGAYYARVLATGSDAFPSAPSAAQSVHLVRVALPPNAFVASDGVIVMPSRAMLSVDAAGLTFATGGGNDAPSALAGALAATPTAASSTALRIKLDPYRVRVVRLRDAAGAEARLTFAARELRARVKLEPAHAHWPQDPIDAVVVLEDASKRLDLATEPVTLEVAVDARPVPTTWTRSGDTFRARIAPVDGPGPFFVRVVAKDQTGVGIGSFVLDIDGRRPLKPLN